MEVTIPAHLSHNGVEHQATKGIDSCIAPIVEALNAGGVTTISSCCGHGKSDGTIMLADGRELVIRQRQETTNETSTQSLHAPGIWDRFDRDGPDNGPTRAVEDRG